MIVVLLIKLKTSLPEMDRVKSGPLQKHSCNYYHYNEVARKYHLFVNMKKVLVVTRKMNQVHTMKQTKW